MLDRRDDAGESDGWAAARRAWPLRASSPADLSRREGEGMGEVTDRVGTGGRRVGVDGDAGKRRVEGGSDLDSGETSAVGIVTDHRRAPMSLGGSGGDASSTGAATMNSVSSAVCASAGVAGTSGERCGAKNARIREPAVVEPTLEAERRRRRRLKPNASMLAGVRKAKRAGPRVEWAGVRSSHACAVTLAGSHADAAARRTLSFSRRAKVTKVGRAETSRRPRA